MLRSQIQAQLSVVPAYSVSEAARELSVTVRMIYLWLADGTLAEMRLAAGKTRLVSQQSVLDLKAKRQTTGAA